MNAAASPSKLRPVIIIVVAGVSSAVGAIVGNSVVQAWRNNRSDVSIDRTLAKSAEEINRNLPMMVDRVSRLDATAALPGKKLLYRYTLIDAQLAANGIVSKLRPKAIQNFKTAQNMAALRAMGVTLVYSYYDEAGAELTTFEVGPADIR
jgi:hypothetical protein